MFRTHGIKKHLNKLGTNDDDDKNGSKPKAAKAVDVEVKKIVTLLTINNDKKENLELQTEILQDKLEEVKEEKIDLVTRMAIRKKNKEDGRDITFEESMDIVKDTVEDAAFLLMKNVPLNAVDEDSKKAANIMERHWDIDCGIKRASNQLYSGRCWMFAGLNILVRQLINLKHFEPTFELSQSYLFFWHYVEQYNDVLSLFRYKPELRQSFNRERNDILEEPLHDGANWINFYRLVKKYGVVPKSMMPETIPSSSSSEMKETLADMLASDLKDMEALTPGWDTIKDSDEKRKKFNEFRNEKMIRVVTLLCKYMGKPPLSGTIKLNTVAIQMPIDHPDKNENSSLAIESPQAFFYAINNIYGARLRNGAITQIMPIHIDDLVQIINDTRPAAISPYDKRTKKVNGKDMPLGLELSLDNTWYTTTYQEHKVHRNLLYNMKKIDHMIETVLQSLLADKPVWFACNMNTNVDKRRQGMDVDLFRPDLFTGFKLDMDRENRMKYGRAHCNHAMLIVGAETKVVTEGNTGLKQEVIAFNVENSWGDSGPNGGFYKMSIEWFKARVYTVVIHNDIVSKVLSQHGINGFKEPTVSAVLGIFPSTDFFG
jgi:bleomycin hydrolase